MWVLALSLLGCNSGTSTCEAYVDAYNACAESYQGTTITTELLGCDDAAGTFADYYDCLSAAYESADCTTDDGWVSAAEDASLCEAPTE